MRRRLRALVEWQIEQGTDGLVPVGTTGESPTLSHAEHERVVELVIEAAAGRVPVIAGAGSNATAEAISLSRHAKKVGADAHPGRDALLQQADPGGAVRSFQGDPRRGRPAADHLQHPGPLGGRHERRDDGGARPAAECGRGQGRDRRPGAAAADHARLRRRLLPAVRARTSPRSHFSPTAATAASRSPRTSRRANAPKCTTPGSAAMRRSALAMHLRLTPLHRALFLETSPAPVEIRGRPSRQMRARRAPAAGHAERVDQGEGGRRHGRGRPDQLSRRSSRSAEPSLGQRKRARTQGDRPQPPGEP